MSAYFLESLYYKHFKENREQIQLASYTRECLWRLIYAKNPDMQTRYNAIVNMYVFKYSHENMLIRIVGC